MRLQADLHNNEFAVKSSSKLAEAECSVGKVHMKSGNCSKTSIRNIDIKDFGPTR
jgi:hypothetical protein